MDRSILLEERNFTIKPKRNTSVETIVIGIDSETCYGEPITIQLYSNEQSNMTKCLWVNGGNASTKLFSFLDKQAKPHAYYRMYGHHLKFDLISFFWENYYDLADLDGFEFTIGNWIISGFYGTPCFVRAIHKTKKCKVEIVDSFLWFSSSLAVAADTYCPDIPKLTRPKGLGTTKYKKTDYDFIDYAMQDSIIAARLGRLIENMHVDLQIKPQVSLAGMSSQTFLAHFLKHEIKQVPLDFIQPSVAAYHGGKNNTYPGAAPRWHIGINSYDLKSAYPYAMTFVPGFSNEAFYRTFRHNRPSVLKSVPEHGTYCISGTIKECEWPCLFNHNFTKATGVVKDLWVSGFDLNEALRTEEVKLKSIFGCYYDAPDSEDRPLKRFIDHFYKDKEFAENPIDRFRAKILMNSLYGKFIQTKETHVDDNGHVARVRVAAGLFQPMIAGSITSHTRATMHYLEHELKAIHTATDGIFTYNTAPKNLKLPKKGLGSLELEAQGDLALIRNKLYILYSEDGKIPSTVFTSAKDKSKPKKIKKHARHAFMGTLRNLEEYLAFGKRAYTVNKPNTLKDAIKRDLIPNEFTDKKYVLRVGAMSTFDIAKHKNLIKRGKK